MNQDCLENFFAVIRGKGAHRTNPNTVEFRSSYGQTCIDMMFSKSNQTNCEGDFEGFLLKLGQISVVRPVNKLSEVQNLVLCQIPLQMLFVMITQCLRKMPCNM